MNEENGPRPGIVEAFESNSFDEIPLDIRRSVIQEKIRRIQAQAVDFYTEIESMKAQSPGGSSAVREVAQEIKNTRAKYRNCVRSARRLKELLDELPESAPEEEPELVEEDAS